MTNIVSTLTGIFKERYADKVVDLIPDGVVFLNDVPFVQEDKQIGNLYHQPVIVTNEHGFTYAGASAGAFSINTPIAAVHQDAQVSGAQILLESRIDYESLGRAQDNKRAFEKVMDLVVRNMINSMAKRVEIECLFGGNTSTAVGIGRILTSVVAPATTATLVIRIESWAAALFAGLENAQLDCYDNNGAGGIPSTQRNTNAALVVSSVTVSSRTVVVTGNAADIAAIATDDYLYFRGAFGNEAIGMNTIVQNTGTLFNIAGGTYSLWQGNTYDAGGAAMTMQKVFASLDGPVARGLDESICYYTNPRTWTNIMNDLAALRRFDGSYSKTKGADGFQKIEFYSQSGMIEITPHKYVPEGRAIAFPKSQCKRLGSTDVTFKAPGTEDEFFYQLPSNAGVGMRCYTMFAPFCNTIARCVAVSNIVNT